MKKVFRILLILAILCTSGCDFLRRVAGRPTSAELESKAERLEAARTEKLEAARAEKAKAAVQDSIKTVSPEKIEASLKELGRMKVCISSEFRYGSPVKPIQYKYNVIAGVFRNTDSAAGIVEKAKAKGYGAFLIAFTAGVNAVCLAGADSPETFPGIIARAREDGLSPSDTWVYIKKD